MAYSEHSTAAPAEHPTVERQRIRLKLERVIDKLIAALDAIDGDADLEEGGDAEPALGFQEARVYDSQDNVIRFSPTGGSEWLDLEEACEDEGGEHDGREPEHEGFNLAALDMVMGDA